MAAVSGCCGICSRIILVCINLLYLIIGIGLSALGIVLTIFHKYLDSLTNENYTLPSILLMVVGLLVLLMSVVGIIGAALGKWYLLIFYSLYILILVGLLMAAGVWLINHSSKIENTMNQSFHNMMMNYSYSNPDSTVNDVVDFIQRNFKCCGDEKLWQWYFTPYFVDQKVFPRSCLCNDEEDEENCATVKIPLSNYNSGVPMWQKGCNETFYGEFNQIINGIGIAFTALSSFSVLIFCLSCGVCCCSAFGKKKQTKVFYYEGQEQTGPINASAPLLPDDYGNNDYYVA